MYATSGNIAKLTQDRQNIVAYSTIVLVALFLTNCTSPEKFPLKEYYVPEMEVGDSTLLTYEAIYPPNFPDEKWVLMRTKGESEIPLLLTKTYDFNDRLVQDGGEELTQIGAVSRYLTIYTYDSLGLRLSANAEILEDRVFPFFTPDPGDFYRHKIKWVDPRDTLEYTLEKERYFKGDTTIEYRGNKYEAIAFDLVEKLETFWEHDGMTNSEWTGREVYARGLGLVYYEKNISPALKKAYRLK